MKMRIAELSHRSGVPIPTIKYYMREGLVPPGRRTSPNQAQYEESHLRRLRLARALIEVGGLPIAVAHEVLTALEAKGDDVHLALGKAQYLATYTRRTPDHDEDGAAEETRRLAKAEVTALLAEQGWWVNPGSPALAALIETVATLHRLGQEDYLELLPRYAEAAAELAVDEVEGIARRPDTESMAEGVVIWTVLGDSLLAALRRLAQENESSKIFDG
jgi:DNA-binding transcriptional MerR regulator